MRIALVVYTFTPHAGGAEIWTWQFARALVDQGHQLHVVATAFADECRDWPIVRHAVSARGRMPFAHEAERLLTRLDVDVVHDTGIGWYCDFFQPHFGSRTASFERNLALAPFWSRPGKRLAALFLPRYREFDEISRRQYAQDGRRVIALSRMVAEDMQRYHDLPPESIDIVYNGVDTRRFTPKSRWSLREPMRAQLGAGDEEIVLAIVAHNFELKGVPTAIRAVGRLSRGGAPLRLVVAGGGGSGRYRRLARRVGARVDFLGSVSQPEALYAAADMYVQPTYYDPCSLVVLEALSAGLPVITSRFNGAGELITPGVEGHIVQDPGDDRELARAIEHWLAPAARDTGGQGARQLALEHSFDRNVHEIVRCYEQFLRAGRARAGRARAA